MLKANDMKNHRFTVFCNLLTLFSTEGYRSTLTKSLSIKHEYYRQIKKIYLYESICDWFLRIYNNQSDLNAFLMFSFVPFYYRLRLELYSSAIYNNEI